MHRITTGGARGGRHMGRLPHGAFVRGVHFGPGRTAPVGGELRQVRERDVDARPRRRVRVGEYPVLERLFLHHLAPGVGRCQPEHLLGAVLVQAGQRLLRSAALLHQPTVRPARLLQTAVVGNVLALSDDAVDLGRGRHAPSASELHTGHEQAAGATHGRPNSTSGNSTTQLSQLSVAGARRTAHARNEQNYRGRDERTRHSNRTQTDEQSEARFIGLLYKQRENSSNTRRIRL